MLAPTNAVKNRWRASTRAWLGPRGLEDDEDGVEAADGRASYGGVAHQGGPRSRRELATGKLGRPTAPAAWPSSSAGPAPAPDQDDERVVGDRGRDAQPGATVLGLLDGSPSNLFLGERTSITRDEEPHRLRSFDDDDDSEGEEATAPAGERGRPAAGPADVAPSAEPAMSTGGSPAEACAGRRSHRARRATMRSPLLDEDAGRMSIQMIDPSGAGAPGSSGSPVARAVRSPRACHVDAQTADVPLSMLPFFRFLNAEGKRSIMKQLVDQFQSTSITPSSTAAGPARRVSRGRPAMTRRAARPARGWRRRPARARPSRWRSAGDGWTRCVAAPAVGAAMFTSGGMAAGPGRIDMVMKESPRAQLPDPGAHGAGLGAPSVAPPRQRARRKAATQQGQSGMPMSPFPMVDTPGHISESALDKMFEGEPLLTNDELHVLGVSPRAS